MELYYFLASALPTISLKTKPDLSFEEISFMLEVNLNKRDLDKFILFRRFIDILNLRLLWQNKEIDSRGNLNSKELEDVTLIRDILPFFVFEFLDKYEKLEDRLKYFPFLISSFFKMILKHEEGFLKFYFSFERDYRLVLSALRAKKLRKDIVRELQFEDMTDDLVAYIIAQKDSDVFEPPMKWEKLKTIYKENVENPRKLNLAFLEYKFNKIMEFSEKEPFSINQILAFVANLMIIEDYNKLNVDEGKQLVENL